MTGICEESDCDIDDDDDDDDDDLSDLEGAAPTPKRRRLAREEALERSLASGLYPQFSGCEGPSQFLDPSENNELAFVQLVWPTSLCELIAVETNRYARQKKRPKWVDVSTDEVWVFLGIVVLMGIHRLPQIKDYWSMDSLLGVPAVQRSMSLRRFWELWSNLHLVDNETAPASGGPARKIQPLLDILTDKFLMCYNPGQELSVDEGMVKYKGRAKGKVHMPKKPVKVGYKIWCCSCSCCGYLCNFQVYEGRTTDPVSRKKISEKGLTMRVVSDLTSPFEGLNHVVYCDNFYTSGPLIEMLANKKIFVVGTIKRTAAGFPPSLKDVKPEKGSYVSTTVGSINYFVFHDRKVVCFATNVFPKQMGSKVARTQPDGVLRYQCIPPLLPAYNKFMCGADRTGQLLKSYAVDRKSKRCWLRMFYQSWNYAVNNAYVLYKHCCKRSKVKAKSSLRFHLELARLLLEKSVRVRRRSQVDASSSRNLSGGVCCLVRLSDIGLKRGRCHQCLRVKRKKAHSTSFGCSVCRVRLCKTTCFKEFHQY